MWSKTRIVLLSLVTETVALACAPAPRHGTWVDIADESAVIVWDEVAHTETFIRRAAFRVTTPGSFGFLVPTPEKPELGATDDALFDRLERATKPEVVGDEGWRLEPCLPLVALASFWSMGAAPRSGVDVLERKRVAGLDAVELAADDPHALATWLASNGFDDRPALEDWLAPYVAQHWVVTAFKIPEGGRALETSAVRMSFHTPRPFFPYREPADQHEAAMGPRLLRLYLVAAHRMDASLGTTAWPGETVWADALPATMELPVAAARGAWLTKLEDRSSPRHGTNDVFFASVADRALRPVEHVDRRTAIPIPLDVIVVGGAAALVLRRRRRRAR